MRRVLALPVLAIALLAAAGVAMADDVNGPKCADISFTGGDVFYSSAGTVNLTVLVPTASCPSIAYTLVVLAEAGDPTPLATDTERGDGSAFNADGTDIVQLQRTVSDTDDDVCIYATTTSASGSRVFDRAPDTGCVPLTKGGAPGGGGFN